MLENSNRAWAVVENNFIENKIEKWLFIVQLLNV